MWVIDMGYGISIWLSPMSIWSSGYRYGIWANDMVDDSIDMVDDSIDMVDDSIDTVISCIE